MINEDPEIRRNALKAQLGNIDEDVKLLDERLTSLYAKRVALFYKRKAIVLELYPRGRLLSRLKAFLRKAL